MIKFFLKRILAWFASISWEDFLRIVHAAEEAADLWKKSAELTEVQKQAVNRSRSSYVRDWIYENLDWLTGSRMNLVLEIAVNWLNKTKGGAS